jgi:hypothetical protein
MAALLRIIARHPVLAFMVIGLGAGFLTAAIRPTRSREPVSYTEPSTGLSRIRDSNARRSRRDLAPISHRASRRLSRRLRVAAPGRRPVRLRRRGTRWLISWAKRSQCSGNVPAICVGTWTALPVTDRLAALENRWTALPNRARSVVGEHPGGLNATGTAAGSVLSAELAGRAPPQADGIVR